MSPSCSSRVLSRASTLVDVCAVTTGIKCSSVCVVSSRLVMARSSKWFDLKEYAGRYHHEMLGNITVKVLEDKLELDANGFLKLSASHWHYDTFQSDNNNRYRAKWMVSFHLNESGKIEELVLNGDRWKKVADN